MPEHQRGGLGGLLEVLERVDEEVVARTLDRADADEARLAEQRRAREGEELAAPVPVGLEVAHLQRRVLGSEEVAQHAARPLGQHGLGAGDEHDGRRTHLVPGELRDRRRLRARGCAARDAPDRAVPDRAANAPPRSAQVYGRGPTSPRSDQSRNPPSPSAVSVAVPDRSVRTAVVPAVAEEPEQAIGRMPVAVVGADADDADGRVELVVEAFALVRRSVVRDLHEVDRPELDRGEHPFLGLLAEIAEEHGAVRRSVQGDARRWRRCPAAARGCGQSTRQSASPRRP